MIAATRESSRKNGTIAPPAARRVAIYTRQSVADDLEFGSLQAQREAAEAYVKAQASLGWVVLPERYDDHGFSGGTIDRPAFKRLLQHVEQGKIDVVAVHRLDRLSRSLNDFVRVLELLSERGVSFCSTTQAFDTGTSLGRMTVNLLATFATYERDLIRERTHEKMAATRKRGMWTGGQPVLGYDVREKKLIVNAGEAETVRTIFDLFLRLGSILGTVEELGRMGILTKQRKPWDRAGLRRFLENPIFVGRVSYKGEEYPGAHEGIVPEETWQAAQVLLSQKTPEPRSLSRSRTPALLRGLVRCGVCNSLMVPHYSQKGNRRFSYYVCQKAEKQGASSCPGSRYNAHELESAVVERIRCIGKDPELIAATVRAAEADMLAREPKLTAERRKLEQEVKKLAADRANLLQAVEAGGSGISVLVARLGEVDDVHRTVQKRLQAIESEIRSLKAMPVDDDDLRHALESFGPVWDELFPREKARIIQLLVQEVKLYAAENEIEITFRPDALRLLGVEKENATP